MRKLIYSLLWAVCGMSAAPAQAQHAFRVMEYNVENLFDCRHDSLKQDTEFLPGSVRNWMYRRFQDKVNKFMPDWNVDCSWRNIRHWIWFLSDRRCVACTHRMNAC
jgi:hypothetical protein